MRFLLLLLMMTAPLLSQNLPDRVVTLDPLARSPKDTARFVFLAGTHL